MCLQEVLKEREAEIAVLEGSLKTPAAPVTPLPHVNGNTNGDVNGLHLSPKTISQFNNIRRSMSHEMPVNTNFASLNRATTRSSRTDFDWAGEGDDTV
ncbi:hypothetical protein B0H10DRAFT_2102819 [Mycena sp. CBHHK59/15]|nr:hypothetical protein B0H10DRAFT_2156639 [Mycena sp. CBHHK59/15]KAJ6576346.1 hypothetical protein B0H10DRAFT_2102819 [Mycena sp. CBHHK59/15]